MTTTKKLTSALNTIAEYMFEPGKVWDKDLREEVDGNVLAYPQKRILNGIAYAACTALTFAEQRVDEQKTKINELIRSHRNDEISERRLAQALDYMDNLNLQVAALQTLKDEALDVYAAHTGEPFTTPVLKPRVDTKFQSAAMERAAKAGLLNEELTQGGGVEVAAA